MNNKQKIYEMFQALKPESRQIGVFNQRRGNWCRASFSGFRGNNILLDCSGLEDFASPFVFLGQLAFSFSMRFSFITCMSHLGNRAEFPIPRLLLPITKVLGENEHGSKRENYRVKPDEEESVATFQNIQAKSEAKLLNGRLTDISAGGLGLSIDMHTLQDLGEGDQFILMFDLSIDEENEDHIKIVATLRNARPLRHQQIQLGFSFHPKTNPNIDFKQFDKRLQNYVALKQRQILKKRTTTRDESKL